MATANSHGGHKHDEGIVKAIVATINPPAMLADLGCGDGWYCQQLKQVWKNTIIHGYEGCVDMKTEGVYYDIFIIDLSLRRYVDIKYDLVLCIEVGEHIPLEREQVFLDNVRDFCSGTLIRSWATPRQGGRGHFNERPEEYIREQMEKRGFYVDDATTDILRNEATLKWLKRTVAVSAA